MSTPPVGDEPLTGPALPEADAQQAAAADAADVPGPGQRRYLRRITGLAACGGALFGYDTGVISGALPFMTDDLRLSAFDEGLITSSLLVGAAVGSVTGGRLADRIGRRKSLFAAGLVFVLGALGVAAAPDLPVMVVARFVLGLAVGAASVAVPVYLAELAPAADRGRLVSLNSLMIVIGQLLAYLVNAALTPTGNWRLMLGLAAIPAVALVIGCVFVPETPRWLQMNGRPREAVAVLRRTRSEREVEREFHRQQRAARQAARRQERAGWGELVGTAWLRRTLVIGVGIGVLQQVTGINTIIYFAPTILEGTGMSTSASVVATIAIGAISVLSVWVGLRTVDRVGRRPLLIVGQAAGAVCLFALALVINSADGSMTMSVLTLALMVAFLAFQQSTVSPVTWLLIAELFPARIKGLAGGATTMALWLTNFVVSLTFLPVHDRIGGAATFGMFGVIGLACLVFTLIWVPETKGKSLEQIEQELRSAVPARSDRSR